MKKLLTILSIIACINSFSQGKISIRVSAALPRTTPFVVSNLTEMAAYADSSPVLVVKDTLVGGLFNLKPSSDALTVDNGIVFQLNDGRYAVRDISQSDGVNIEWFGATGDGVTNDSAAIIAAIGSGHKIISSHKNKVYLTGALTQSTIAQVFDFSQDTIRLKANSRSYILTLTGAYSQVVGGIFDGNKAAGQVTSDGYYDHAAVYINASYCTVRNIVSINSAGLGIKGGSVDYINIYHNVVKDWNIQGIFVEGTGRDCLGNTIEDNTVFINAGTGVGIYLKGENSPFAYKQRKWSVVNNHVFGPSSSTTTADICITVRGVEGVCSGNVTKYGDMGISCDITSNSVISNNQIDSTNGATGYGIEVNASGNTISGNKVNYTKYGIVSSGSTFSLSNNTISGNNFTEQTVYGIYFNPSSGNTANNLNINGNTFTNTISTAGWNAVRLKRDCRYSQIANNKIVGSGVGISNSRALFLDSAIGFIQFVENSVSGVERPVSCYNTSGVAYTNVSVNKNDFSNEALSETFYFVTEGSATIGNYCTQIGNITSTGYGTDWIDKTNNVLLKFGTSSPESVVTAGLGSLFYRKDGALNTTLYIKQTGTSNTGWIPAADATTNTNQTITGVKTLSSSVTASAALARGFLVNNTLSAAADNDVLINQDNSATFTDNAHTGVKHYGLRVNAGSVYVPNGGITVGSSGSTAYSALVNTQTTTDANVNAAIFKNESTGTSASSSVQVISNDNGLTIKTYGSTNATSPNEVQFLGSTSNSVFTWKMNGNERMRVFNDGNLLLQNAGTFTNAGFRLEVNGTSRFDGNATFSTGIIGTTTNDDAAAGNIGAYVSSLVASGSAVSLTTATGTNITSISLTAGDWDVSGNVSFAATTATVTGTSGGITSTTATVPTDGSEVYSGVQVTLLSENDGVTLPRKRFSLSGTTTVYLVGKCTFSAGSVAAFGSITARRVR